jgi:hypothetical protein
MAPGAWPLAYGRLPGPGTARHLLVGSSQSPPRPGGPTDRDMVASLLYGREPQKFSISDMRGTTNKLKPRQQVTRLWLDELKDIADISGCSRVLSLGSPPTFDDVIKALPTSEVRMATTFHQLMEMEWVSANTRLYHLIRKSIDLGGPMQESDLEYISKHFVRGELRDGVGLLRWLHSWPTIKKPPH